MSSDLCWQVIRNNSCFLHKQRGINKLFSTEKFNLKGRNSRRYNGLVNAKAIDISPAADGKGIILSTKTTKLNKPAKSTNEVTIKNADRTLASVKKVAKGQGLGRYAKLAQRRAAAILRSQRPKSQKNYKKTEA